MGSFYNLSFWVVGLWKIMWVVVILQVILLVGTQLQVIITKMGLRIQERGDVIKGTPVVQPGDDLFWFGQPRFLLYLIHFVLFQVFLKYINKLHITVCL
jgi:mlo protein